MNTDLVSYYRERANEYELIYRKPERQESLLLASRLLQDLCSGKHVLEIACGTGYWTERIAKTASSILATDINEAVIEIAKQKDYGSTAVELAAKNLFELSPEPEAEVVFGGFIWSHILLQELDGFIKKVESLAKRGGLVVFMDNIYHEGSNTPIAQKDAEGNTWQNRVLQDGSSHLVLKNFPTEAFLRSKLGNTHSEFQYHDLGYYWLVSYMV